MAYYTVRYSYTTVRTRLEFSETDLRTVSGYDQFAVNSSQVEFLLTVRTNILVKHHPADWAKMHSFISIINMSTRLKYLPKESFYLCMLSAFVIYNTAVLAQEGSKSPISDMCLIEICDLQRPANQNNHHSHMIKRH